MEGRSFLRRKDREALRERGLLRAGPAFEGMFAEAHQDQLVTFTEREDMACLIAFARQEKWPKQMVRFLHDFLADFGVGEGEA